MLCEKAYTVAYDGSKVRANLVVQYLKDRFLYEGLRYVVASDVTSLDDVVESASVPTKHHGVVPSVHVYVRFYYAKVVFRDKSFDVDSVVPLYVHSIDMPVSCMRVYLGNRDRIAMFGMDLVQLAWKLLPRDMYNRIFYAKRARDMERVARIVEEYGPRVDNVWILDELKRYSYNDVACK